MMKLNTEQKEAVNCDIARHAKVVAGAGTGKTGVLVARAVHLVTCHRVHLREIRLVAFTKNASKVMNKRIKKTLGLGTSRVATTFHSFCMRILKNCPQSKLAKFTTLDEEQLCSIIKDCMRGVDPKLINKATRAVEVMNKARINQECPVQALKDRYQFNVKQAELLINLYAAAKRKAMKLDYCDMLFEADKLLSNEKAAKWTVEHCRYMLIDEAQDLNTPQWSIVDKLICNGTKVFCVGDPAQSIFEFSGGVVEKFIDFDSMYKGTQTYYLSENYRSSPEIVEVSNWYRKQINKQMNIVSTNCPSASKPTIADFDSLQETSAWLANKLKIKKLDGTKLSQIAILIRGSKQGDVIKKALEEAKIPIKKKGVKNGVSIITIHKAKGREWPTCYLIDPRLTASQWGTYLNNKQTEHCLWYVAITRAKKELVICSSTSRQAAYSGAKKSDKFIIDDTPSRLLQFDSSTI
ncbi:UvrD-helicase domain-containing protein [Shewanella kaireitica]|uniref:UvrD-helicase domain-containing protein n=1 Tax=Shewanella kaireitica TaxID=212021 RepID=UPI00200FF739|nr:UvrD-helicase domain-containing protein [Shewanella kaireitica]MCL1096163.1 UvrD-helicase domain-containing protein [Shewanella kaireitica]